jgi:CMP-N,N'-diacetyllegionaminic acid synthase
MTSAIIVARAGSQRLPRKALLPFGNSTLVGHKVHELSRCENIDRIYLGSDSHEILEEGEAQGAIAVLRDAYHCDESRCSANEMIEDMARKVEGDFIVWAHPTNPLVKPETYDTAVEAYRVAWADGFDSLMSVTRIQRHAWYGKAPINYSPWGERHVTAANLAPVDVQDGAIFIQSWQRFIETRYFFGGNPFRFPIPAVEGLDVDTVADYETACRLFERPVHVDFA